MEKILKNCFDTFLTNLIPFESEKELVSFQMGAIFSCLQRSFSFLELCEAGSFARELTTIRGYSSRDLLAVCPEKIFPWSPADAIAELKNVLKGKFPGIKGIYNNKCCVKIPLGNTPFETVQIFPAIFKGYMQTTLGMKPYYSILNPEGVWTYISPKAQQDYLDAIDIPRDGMVRKMIRLLKAWKYYYLVPINSYYLELCIAKYAKSQDYMIYDIDFKAILQLLYDTNLENVKDPVGISGYIKPCNSEIQKQNILVKIEADLLRATIAVELRAMDLAECLNLWNTIFCKRFPINW
ncbi:hypothetical protein PV783_13570 [Chitinophaga sp. CC14]|uniref:hypothetical protein n=1 Tax=Chitinophaga sp. CC14 TaxID=3029199 RepID=UPI003B81B26F